MSKNTTLGLITEASNLRPEDKKLLSELVTVFSSNQSRNETLSRYYHGKITAAEVNIGIAVPEDLARLKISCSWPQKVVEALKQRSIFDCYWHTQGEVKAEFDQITQSNNLVTNYKRGVTNQLTHGCVFICVTPGVDSKAQIRWHTAKSAAALWDGINNRVKAGFAIVDRAKYNGDKAYRPSHVNLFTDTDTIVLKRVDVSRWVAEYVPHKLGRPMMTAMVYQPSFERPFGKSRISPAVMHLTDGYLRCMLRTEVGAEMFTSPQKVLLGADESLSNELRGNYKAYISNVLTISADENGDVPKLEQLASASMSPHIDVMRSLAAQLAGATDVPISELGVIHDNPSSSEAIYAAKEALICQAEELNDGNGAVMRDIALMAYAINHNLSFGELPDDVLDLVTHYKSPAMPSLAATADAAVKIASADEGFAGTDVFYSLLGLDAATIQQIHAEKTNANADTFLAQLLDKVTTNGNNNQG